MYILTQLAKMLFLATFFPMSELEEEEGAHKFDFFNDFLLDIGLSSALAMSERVRIYRINSGLAILEVFEHLFKPWMTKQKK